MESIIKHFLDTLKDLQGLIGVFVGWWITYKISKKERLQKEKITESERIDKYRLSAINERLAAHQKAFEIWYNLAFKIHEEKDRQSNTEVAREFWKSHCLYLTPKCRKIYDGFIFDFSMYGQYRQIWFDTIDKNEKKKRSDELVTTFNRIMNVGKIIQEEVDISYTEPEPITKLKEEENKKLKD